MHYPKRVVVIGHGMVGHRFVEALRARDTDDGWHVTVVAEGADALRTMAAGATTGVVIGGGLLGLEAANALRGFGLHAHVVERAPRLMNQQLDTAGGALLQRMVTELGISVHVDVGIDAIEQCGADASEGRSEATREGGSEGRSEATREGGLRVLLSDGTPIDAGVGIFAAGVRP